jgi:hypothetical protein
MRLEAAFCGQKWPDKQEKAGFFMAYHSANQTLALVRPEIYARSTSGATTG